MTPLGAGHHACLFYTDTREQLRAVTTYLRQGLARGERCLYLVHERGADEVAAALAGRGVDVVEALRSERLLLMSASDAYRASGPFRPADMLAFLQRATEQALRQGFPTLRASGEMSWALRDHARVERLIEYEALVEAWIRENPVIGLCQYNLRRFPAATVHGVLRTHRHVCYRRRLRASPFFGSHVSSIDWMLRQLKPVARRNGPRRTVRSVSLT